ncbi:MAG: helix-turn-helix domain-containing protein [Candidatus Omnitrophota bacterium]
MTEEKLLTVRDVSIILAITEKEVMDLAEKGVIPAYKVGGVFLRFKKEQVLRHKKITKPSALQQEAVVNYPLRDKIGDFLYFNDFYIVTTLTISILMLVIFWGN